MRALQIVGIGIRLFAVLLVITSARYATSLWNYGESLTTGGWIAWISSAVVLPAGLAIYLWFFPLTVANRIVPRLKAEEELPPLNAGDLQAIGFSLVGLWLLATAIPDAFYWMLLRVLYQRTEGAGPFSPDQIAGVWSTVAEIGVGFVLLFGARGLRGLLHRFRTAGP